MEIKSVNVKTEPSQTHASISYPLPVDSSAGAHQLSVVYNAVSDGMKPQLGSISIPQCQGDGQHMDVSLGYMDQNVSLSNPVKSEYYTSDPTSQRMSTNLLDPLVNLTRSTGNTNEILPGTTFQRSFSSVKDTGPEITDPNEMNQLKSSSCLTPKPSEALFVRALIGRCKRIAPLWFRGVSSMRERNREENRRMASNNGQTQSDWSLIGLKIAEMNAGSETDAVANLLKKLYKELPTDSVFWFLKCWLGSEDSRKDPDSCVISRGDAKGRMRRIDGGKGSDKVWRLDTIVGMLYHGLPMSSTDTNIMVHTCDQELCVRPQHIRFRASSVALVVVLKALAQAGYTVIPPPVAAGPNGVAPNASDESVDVFGPFTIEELQQYRSENLVPAEDSISKLTLNASDREFADTVPVIRAALQGVRCDNQPVISSSQSMISHMNGYHPTSTRVKLEPTEVMYRPHNRTTTHPHLGPVLLDPHSPRSGLGGPVEPICTSSTQLGRSSLVSSNTTTTNSTTTTSTKQSLLDDQSADGIPNSPNSVCLPVAGVAHRVDRRSLKRPAPSDSPCSFPSSPVRMSHHPHQQHHPHPRHQPAPQSSSPPLLISDMANSVPGPHQRHPSVHHRLSDSTLQAPVLLPNNTVLPCLTQTTEPIPITMCNPLAGPAGHVTTMDSNVPFPLNRGSENMRLENKPFQSNGLATGSPGSSTMLLLHQPLALPLHHHTHHSQPSLSNGPSGFGVTGLFGSGATPSGGGGGSSSSGKTTPRQPAKKRLEARTPTIEGSVTDESSNGAGPRGTPIIGAGSDDSNSTLLGTGSGGAIAFRVHQNTPFVPVQSRSGRPSSSGSASSGSIVPNLTATSTAESLGGTSSSGPGASLIPTANRRLAETEEGEMDQELVDIMVRRSGSTGTVNCCPNDATGSQSSCTLGTEENSHRNLIYPPGIPANLHATELSNSPTGRRIIEALAASLTSSHGSPLHDNSTPINPRRSASACSLPRLGASPNDELAEFLLHPNANGSARFFSSPTGIAPWHTSRDAFASLHPNGTSQNTNNKSHWLSEYVALTGRRSAGRAQHGASSATPPPSASVSATSAASGELRLLSGTRMLGQSTLHTPTLNGDGTSVQDSSVQELASVIRNSPACGISQELIDMLANMAQQYGVQQPRPGSGASRPSSQVAQRFYRSLVNGSVCGSPFLVASASGSTTSGSAANSAQPLSASSGISSGLGATTSTSGTNPLLSPTNTVSGQHQTAHHLRGLSFTPLAVDADLGNANLSATTLPSVGNPATGVSSISTCTVPSPIKHSCAVENTSTVPMSDLSNHSDEIPTSGSAGSSGNGFFAHRRSLKQ